MGNIFNLNFNNKHNRGSAVSETLIVLLFCVAFVISGFNAISMSVSRMWLEHSLYWAIQCELASGRSCRRTFNQRAKFLGWGHIQALQIDTHLTTKNYKLGIGQITWCNTHRRALCDIKNKLILKMQLKEKDLAALRSWRS